MYIYVRNVGCVFPHLYILDDDSESTMDYELYLPHKFFPWSCIYYYVHKKSKFVAIFILDNQDYEDVTAAQGKTVWISRNFVNVVRKH